MRQDQETLNGSTALIVYTLGEIRADVRETRSDIRILTKRLDTMQPRPSPLDRLKDLSGFLTALAVVVLAVAGKYDLIGYLVGSGR
jgi:hypothetical protein